MIARACRSLAVGAAALLAVACTERQALKPEIRLTSADFTFRVSAERMPPAAREDDRWRVEVTDRESRQPVQGGEGRIFATSHEGTNSWDGFTPGEEPGVYYGTLSFLTAGEWAMAVQFRADSTKPLQRVDWVQEVMPERPLGTP
jgi:hypothetical protein